jgi:hypothetical protein
MTKSLAVQSKDYEMLVKNIVHLADDYKNAEVTLRAEMMTKKLEAMHAIGMLISTSALYEKGKKGAQEFVEAIGADSGIGKVDAYYCVRFYHRFPTLENFMEKEMPERTVIGWSHVRALLDGKKPVECKHLRVEKIPKCLDCHKLNP